MSQMKQRLNEENSQLAAGLLGAALDNCAKHLHRSEKKPVDDAPWRNTSPITR